MHTKLIRRFAACVAVLAAVLAAVVFAPSPAQAAWATNTIGAQDPSDLEAVIFRGMTFTLRQGSGSAGQGPYVAREIGMVTQSGLGIYLPNAQACSATHGSELIEGADQFLHAFTSRIGGGLCHWMTADGFNWWEDTAQAFSDPASTGLGLTAVRRGSALYVFNVSNQGELRQLKWSQSAGRWLAADVTRARDTADNPSLFHRARAAVTPSGQLHIVYLTDARSGPSVIVDHWYEAGGDALTSSGMPDRFFRGRDGVGPGPVAVDCACSFEHAGQPFDVETTFIGQFHITYIRNQRVFDLWYDPAADDWFNAEPRNPGFLPAADPQSRLRTSTLGGPHGQFQIVYGSQNRIQKPFWDPWANSRRGDWLRDEVGSAGPKGLRGLAVLSDSGSFHVYADNASGIEHWRWS